MRKRTLIPALCLTIVAAGILAFTAPSPVSAGHCVNPDDPACANEFQQVIADEHKLPTCVGLVSRWTFEEGLGISDFRGFSPSGIEFFGWFFYAAMALAAVLALTYIAYGGVRYIASAGSAGGQTRAKEIINNAILGLVLALASFLILYTINDDIVRFNLTGFKNQLSPPPDGVISGGAREDCEVAVEDGGAGEEPDPICTGAETASSGSQCVSVCGGCPGGVGETVTCLEKIGYATSGSACETFCSGAGQTVVDEINLGCAFINVCLCSESMPPPVCGDGSCDAGEDATSCPDDCGAVPPPPFTDAELDSLEIQCGFGGGVFNRFDASCRCNTGLIGSSCLQAPFCSDCIGIGGQDCQEEGVISGSNTFFFCIRP